MFGDTIFDGILILAVWHNRTLTVFLRNTETALHHCTTYLLFMYNMHPVAKCVDEIQCSHFSMDPKQIKYLFLPCFFKPQTLLVPDRQSVTSHVMTQPVPLPKTKAQPFVLIALTCVQVRHTLQTDCAQADLPKYAILG